MLRRRACILTALCLLLIGHGAFRADAQSWKFFVCSDTQSASYVVPVDTNILGEFAAVVAAERPAFVLCAGDLVNVATVENYAIWTNVMSPVYEAGIPIYPVMGNHDVQDLPPFCYQFLGAISRLPTFDAVEKNYAFTWSNALFLMVETDYPLTPHRVNQRWLEAVLATNSAPLVFAVGHEPAFKNNAHRDLLDNAPEERDAFWSALGRAHCRIYFCGHDHCYNHARVDDGDGDPENDVHQIVLGSIGGYLYPGAGYDGTNTLWTPVSIFRQDLHGFVEVRVDGNGVSSIWRPRIAPGIFQASSEVFTYAAEPPRVRGPRLYAVRRGADLELSWQATAYLQTSSEAGGPFTNIDGATSPFVVTNIPAQSRFFRLRSMTPTP